MKFLYTTDENTRVELLEMGLKELKPVALCGQPTYCFSNEEKFKPSLNFSSDRNLVFSDTLFL